MTEQPTWFTQLKHDLNASVMVPDGAAIDWDQCRGRFLIPLLQRLEKRSSSPYPAIVRGLLQRRLAGEDVTAELSAAAAATWAAAERAAADWADWAAADWPACAAWAAADWAACAAWAAADWAAAVAVTRAARAAAVARAANWAANWVADVDAERAAQLADLRAAVAASSLQPALPR